MSLHYEVKDRFQDVLVFSLWDEDGEVDDFVGECLLPLKSIPLDEHNFHPAMHPFRLTLHEDNDVVKGFNSVSQKNDGKVSKLSVEVGYSEFFNSSIVKTKIIDLLQYGSHQVKRAALSTCYSYWTEGEENLLRVLADLIEDESDEIRFASMKVFVELSKYDDEMTIETICKKLTSDDQKCRHLALHILSNIVTQGSAIAVNVVLSLLRETSMQKRDLVFDAITLIADHSLIQTLIARGKDKSDVSRADCLSLLAVILTKDDHWLLAGNANFLRNLSDHLADLTTLMKDEDPGCRRAAVECIAKIALLNKVCFPEATAEARRMLEEREGIEAHSGDPNPIIQSTIRNSLQKIRVKTGTYVDYQRTEEGQFSQLLPAKWVKLSASRGIVSEEVGRKRFCCLP